MGIPCKITKHSREKYVWYHWYFTNKEWYQYFKSLGIVQNKSNKDVLLEVSNLDNHFVRGLFDADGCVSVNKRGEIKAEIVGTEKMINQIRMMLPTPEEFGIYPHKGKNIFSIKTSSYLGVKQFYEYLYKDAENFLDRKRSVFELYFAEHKPQRRLKPVGFKSYQEFLIKTWEPDKESLRIRVRDEGPIKVAASLGIGSASLYKLMRS